MTPRSHHRGLPMVFRYHADPPDVLFGPLGVLRVILIWTCMLKPKHGLGVLDWRPGRVWCYPAACSVLLLGSLGEELGRHARR